MKSRWCLESSLIPLKNAQKPQTQHLALPPHSGKGGRRGLPLRSARLPGSARRAPRSLGLAGFHVTKLV